MHVVNPPARLGAGAPPTDVVRRTFEAGGAVQVARRVYLSPGLADGKLELKVGREVAELGPRQADDLIRSLTAWRAGR